MTTEQLVYWCTKFLLHAEIVLPMGCIEKSTLSFVAVFTDAKSSETRLLNNSLSSFNRESHSIAAGRPSSGNYPSQNSRSLPFTLVRSAVEYSFIIQKHITQALAAMINKEPPSAIPSLFDNSFPGPFLPAPRIAFPTCEWLLLVLFHTKAS
jgi:hypothetical protein